MSESESEVQNDSLDFISPNNKFLTGELRPPEPLTEGIDAPSPELLGQFSEYEEQVRELYSIVDQWHGLGRYNTLYEDEDRTEFMEVQDVLSSILDQGLVPQPDTFQGRLFPRGTRQISTTHIRPYAAMYAYFHDINKICKYRFHDTKFWAKIGGVKLIKNIPKVVRDEWRNNGIQGVKETRPIFYRKGKSKDIETWKKKVDATILEDDYPMLIGLKEGAVSPVRTSWLINASTEKRSHNIIPTDQFTHIEVPLERMDETQALLETKGISIPLIPIEMGEVYSSRFNPKDLMEGNPFKQPR